MLELEQVVRTNSEGFKHFSASRHKPYKPEAWEKVTKMRQIDFGQNHGNCWTHKLLSIQFFRTSKMSIKDRIFFIPDISNSPKKQKLEENTKKKIKMK